MKYTITPPALDRMKSHLTGTYPNEGCGLLAGTAKGSIEEVFYTDNVTDVEKASKHYEIDPLTLYDLEKRAEEKGYRILGFYHSHPDCPANMSSEDSEHMIPRMLYVIASVERGRCGEIRGYVKD
ncbi:MAG: M67 family metallopeptidase [Lachnospiraceae bacterium]|nr:M67 family metallopeptidase [Lachnospiraceae bacterium]